jgi:peptide/nickel transport system substrate-binding protein
VGLQNYRTQTSEDVYAKYQDIAAAIAAAGPDHAWTEGDSFTREQQESYWATLKANWTGVVQAIVDYCMANYADSIQETVGFTPEEVQADEGLKVAFGMALWGFGEVKDGVLTSASGKTWKLAELKPTLDDYYAEPTPSTPAIRTRFSAPSRPFDATPISAVTKEAFIKEWGRRTRRPPAASRTSRASRS